MTPEQAAEAVAVTRREAETAARGDLGRVKAQALQQGLARAEGLFPVGRRPASRAGVTGRSSRILRGWYVEVFSAAVGDRFGERVRVPSAAEVDSTATALRRSLGSREPDAALRLVGSLHRRALTDAASAGAAWEKALDAAGPRRAAAHVARHQPAVDELQAAILRHWYRRSYLATVHAQLRVLQPLQAVTAAEAGEVAAAVEQGRTWQLIGTDGIPLVTRHATVTTDVDRRLAAGEAGVVDPPAAAPKGQRPPAQVTNAALRARVLAAWSGGAAGRDGQPAGRLEWTAGAEVPAAAAHLSWHHIPGDQQSRLIGYWLDTHRMADVEPVTLDEPELLFADQRQLLHGPQEQAAAAMFNHLPDPPTAGQREAASASFPVPAQDSAHSAPADGSARHPTRERTVVRNNLQR